jgi:hypothetical protein
MLSIIVCSRSAKISDELEKNISETIGIDYELIVIDNAKNAYSIFEAYNLGIRKSNYPNLCFAHEDILFKTSCWGQRICDKLKNPAIGFIGVAGGMLMPRVPASWSEFVVAKNFIQSDRENRNKSKHAYKTPDPTLDLVEVCLLDGVLLCCRKEIFDTITFDEATYKGFHAYDLDICLQAKQNQLKNFVVFDVLIEHFSRGFRSKEWVSNLLLLEKKWREYLPIGNAGLDKEELLRIDKRCLQLLLKRMVRLNFNLKEVIDSTSDFWKLIYPDRSKVQLWIRVVSIRILHTVNIH